MAWRVVGYFYISEILYFLGGGESLGFVCEQMVVPRPLYQTFRREKLNQPQVRVKIKRPEPT